jgi:hypothetical protein
MIRVLAVAPRIASYPALATDEELARVGDVPGVQLRSLTQVTRQRMIDRLSRERFDVLLWIGHGGPGMLAVDGQETVDPHWLASQLANYGVGTAIVATCESIQRPESTHLSYGFADVLPAYGIDTITMATAVADRAALEYDVALLQALASGSPLRQAHAVGVAAAAQAGGSQAPMLTPRDGKRKDNGHMDGSGGSAADYRLSNTERMLQQADGKLDRMSEQLSDHSSRLRVLEDRMSALSTKVDHLSGQIDHLRSAPGYSRVALAVGSLVMVVMLLLLLFVTWRLV